MDASKQVDSYIGELNDWRGSFIAQLREIINETDPELTEEWKWGSPVWTKNGLVCSVSAFKDKVKMNFFKKDGLEDSHNLLNAGLESKQPAIDFKEGDSIDTEGVKSLLKGAISLNK